MLKLTCGVRKEPKSYFYPQKLTDWYHKLQDAKLTCGVPIRQLLGIQRTFRLFPREGRRWVYVQVIDMLDLRYKAVNFWRAKDLFGAFEGRADVWCMLKLTCCICGTNLSTFGENKTFSAPSKGGQTFGVCSSCRHGFAVQIRQLWIGNGPGRTKWVSTNRQIQS